MYDSNLKRREQKENWVSFWKYYGPILSARKEGKPPRRPVDEIELDNYMVCLYDFTTRTYKRV